MKMNWRILLLQLSLMLTIHDYGGSNPAKNTPIQVWQIPAMGAEVKRVFSSTSLYITDGRNRILLKRLNAYNRGQRPALVLYSTYLPFKDVGEVSFMIQQLKEKATEDGTILS